jgi:hypothetical protein
VWEWASAPAQAPVAVGSANNRFRLHHNPR